jgi:tetratricopeptide (TPR) repeat protein
MNAPSRPPNAPLDVPLARQLDQVCDRFENAWRAGHRPRLEEFLGDATEPLRSELVRELVRLEMHYRGQAGDRPSAEEYEGRFPTDAELVRSVFAREGRAAPSPPPAAGEPPTVDQRPDTPPPGRPSPEAGSLPAQPVRPDRYELEEEIGRGGMGAVVRARDPDLNRTLAVKVLREDHRGRIDLERRFLEEAQLTGQLQHPGIPPVHEIGRLEDGRPFFAMKLIDGRTLAELLRERSSPAEYLPRFLGIFEQICQAVGYAHSKGVIHRDLKPGNVMVGAFGEVQVMDWGFAKVHRADPDPETAATEEVSAIATARAGAGDSTQAGQVMGTPAYMAPEQARGEIGCLEQRSDVFGLGAILCFILTGRPPYTGASPHEVRRQAEAGRLEEAFARLEACGADEKLVWLARVCLAAEPADRPPHSGAVAEAMAAYQAGVQQRLRQAEVDRARAEVRAGEERKRRRLAVALAALAVLLLAGLAGGALLYQRAERDRALHRAERRGQMDLSLQEAEALHKRALDRTEDADHWRTTLTAAFHALKRAQALLREEGEQAEEAVRRRVGEVKSLLEWAEKDRQLAAEHEQIRLEQAEMDPTRRRFKVQEGYPKLREALRAHGLEVGVLPPVRAAALVEGRPNAVRKLVVAALQDCLWLAPREHVKERNWLREVLDRGDHDRWRTEVRRAVAAADWRTVRQLAGAPRAAQQPPAFALWLALSLPNEEGEARIALLRCAREQHPADFWLNFHLAEHLYRSVSPSCEDRPAQGEELTVINEAVRFMMAAVALQPKKSIPHHDLGLFLKAQGQLDEAIRELRAAIQLDPKLAFPHYNLGMALYAKKQLDEAIRELRKAIHLDPKYARAHNNLGGALRAQGQLDEAIREFRAAVRFDPNSALPHYNLGMALYAKKQLDEAIREFREAIHLDPKLARHHYKLGNALRDKGQLDEAIKAYQEAIQLDPKDALPHNNLGLALQDKGQLDEAIREFQEAIQLDPKLARHHYNLGIALQDKGQLDEAIKAYQEAIQLDPKDALPHNNLGIALRDKGQLDEAIKAYREAIQLDPKLAGPHNNLGNALRDKGQLDEAIREFRKAIQLDPKNALLHDNLDLALRDKGQLDEAIKAYREAIQLDPKLAGPHNGLGVALGAQGQLDEAIREFREAIHLDPKLALPHYNLGLALYAKKQLDEAIREFREAIHLDPKHANSHGALGRAVLHLGRFAEARTSSQRALALLPPGHGLRKGLTLQLQECDRLLKLDARLAPALRDKAKPRDAAERLELAELCLEYTQLPAAAVCFYAEALADATLADGRRHQARFAAARAAARAAAGKGEDAARLDAAERGRLRGRALDWLKASLAECCKELDGHQPQARQPIEQALRLWLTHPDLAGVRDAAALAALPETERAAWGRLWAEVAALLWRAAGK